MTKDADKYVTSFSPTDTEISDIEKWLKEEYNKTREGFYRHWDLIKQSYGKNQIVTISHRKKSIGFLTFHIFLNKIIEIDIAEVKPSYRNKGIGKILTTEFLSHFKSKGIYIGHLECNPAESEPIWKKIGFNEFPDPQDDSNKNSSGNKKLFQILVDSLEPNVSGSSNEKIEIWNNEPYRTTGSDPKYIWNLNFIEGTRKLIRPIIYPAHYKWRVRWTLNGRTIIDDEIKYFGTEIYIGEFIYIEELPDTDSIKPRGLYK